MKIFHFFKSKKVFYANRVSPPVEENNIDKVLTQISQYRVGEDYLGKAAMAGHEAKAALELGLYDKAWGLLHQQKTLYMQHASREKWKEKDTLCLDGSVSEQLADILRLEKKNVQAFAHILYWIITSRTPIKRHKQKLKAYFNRCKFNNVSLADVEHFIDSSQGKPDFVLIQSKVDEWKNFSKI